MAVEIPDAGRLAGDCGFDGTDWIKSSIRLGYQDTVREEVSGAAAAGDNTLSSTSVPSGEVHIIEAICVLNTNTDLAKIDIDLNHGAKAYRLDAVNPPAANFAMMIPGPFTLAFGDYIQAVFRGCNLNDGIYLTILGRKIEVS